MFQKVITYFSEIFNWVFTVHFGENVIVTCLDWDVDKGKDSGMVEEVSNSPDMFQHVRWVGHTDLEIRKWITLIIMWSWLFSY